MRKLRGTGRNLPIVMVSRRLRRVSDRASLIRAGIDVFLRMPAECSLLRPSVWNLLRRAGAVEFFDRSRGEYEFEPLEGEVNCTADLDYFVGRVLRDNAVCQRSGTPPNLLVIRIGRHVVDELSSVAALFTRSADLVLSEVEASEEGRASKTLRFTTRLSNPYKIKCPTLSLLGKS